MNIIENVLNGFKENIDVIELDNFISEYYLLNENDKKSKFILYFIKMIEYQKLSPNLLLERSIYNLKDRKTTCDLFYLSLRYNANVNLYLNIKNLGKGHIIVYIHKKELDEDFTDFLVTILIYLGSNVKLHAFESPDTETSFFGGQKRNEKKLSVNDWIKTNSNKQYNNVQMYFENLDLNHKIQLSIYFNNPQMFENIFNPKKLLGIYETENDEPFENILGQNFSKFIIFRSIKCLEYYETFKYSNLKSKGEYQNLVFCINSYFYEGFLHFVKTSLDVSYYTMNRLIIKYKKLYNEKNIILLEEIRKMIIYSIKNGYKMDLEQIKFLEGLNIKQEILEEYNKPFWMKQCLNINNEPSEELKKLSYNLNIDQNYEKKEICNIINDFYKADINALKKSLLKRQESKMTSELSNISDFINYGENVYRCQNTGSRNENLMEYSDVSVAYYKDENNYAWCFLSTDYENLLDNPINPYTNKKLPEMFQKKIKYQKEIIEKLGMNGKNPTSIPKTLENMQILDEINDIESDNIVDIIITIFKINGILESDYKNMSPEKMNEVLKKIGMEQESLILKKKFGDKNSFYPYELSSRHQLITFCRAVHDSIKVDTNKKKQFLDSIRLLKN